MIYTKSYGNAFPDLMPSHPKKWSLSSSISPSKGQRKTTVGQEDAINPRLKSSHERRGYFIEYCWLVCFLFRPDKITIAYISGVFEGQKVQHIGDFTNPHNLQVRGDISLTTQHLSAITFWGTEGWKTGKDKVQTSDKRPGEKSFGFHFGVHFVPPLFNIPSFFPKFLNNLK